MGASAKIAAEQRHLDAVMGSLVGAKAVLAALLAIPDTADHLGHPAAMEVVQSEADRARALVREYEHDIAETRETLAAWIAQSQRSNRAAVR